jgi:ATP-dependent Lhr-like helicase
VLYVRAERRRWARCRQTPPSLRSAFLDEGGGMQLVIHSPLGAHQQSVGLAPRKRFCRSFNFELQAAATRQRHRHLSLSDQHSFPLELVFKFLTKDTVEGADAGDAAGAHVRGAVALGHVARPGCAAFLPAAARCRRNFSACAPTTCLPRYFPIRPPARENIVGDIGFPITRPSKRRS